MHLHSPTSAILSAVIFNALIIIALIPLALRGVAYKPMGALAILQRNLLIYGFGGVIVPFIGIKLIDLIIAALHLINFMKELFSEYSRRGRSPRWCWQSFAADFIRSSSSESRRRSFTTKPTAV